MQKKLFIVGHFPPVIGGISIHVSRELEILREQFLVRGFDLAGDVKTQTASSACLRKGRVPFVVFSLLTEILFQRPAIVHFHISAGRNAPVVLLLVLWAGLFSKTVLTIHSGSFPAFLQTSSRLRRISFKLLFNRLDLCIGVGEGIVEAVNKFFPKSRCEKTVIPAFLAAPRKQKQDTESRDYLFASGYATKIYDWLCLLDAVENVSGLKRLDMVFYNTYDEPYYQQVLTRAKSIANLKVRIFNDLSQEAFQELMMGADILVRPTLNDGDAVAVREALSARLFVVASDAVVRPAGVVTFPTSDAGALAACLRRRSEFVRTEASETDFSKPLVEAMEALD